MPFKSAIESGLLGRGKTRTARAARPDVLTVDYLLLGGGSGGTGGVNGVNYGSAGAGGVQRTFTQSSADTFTRYKITVGGGGAGVLQDTSGAGSPSVFWAQSANGGNSVAHTSRTGASNDDFAGGTNSSSTNSGGGAGAGANGSGSSGGNGVSSSITGTSVTRGGGGGGISSNTGIAGGLGGGGAGNAGGAGVPGTANLGGGGGGGPAGDGGGNGGSGVIILSIPDTRTAAFSPGVSQTSATSGGRRIYTITAAGNFDYVVFI